MRARAVLISLVVDFTDIVYSRLFKQPIPIMRLIMRPIIKGRLLAVILTENFIITLKTYYLSLKIF